MSISRATQEAIAVIIAALLLLAALLVIANHFRLH
jgi:cell division protein FtsX